MSGLSEIHKAMLDEQLKKNFIMHLPQLLRQGRADEDEKKNISRALSAFYLAKNFGLTEVAASKCVVDDSEDFGIDAIYYASHISKLYLIQAKYKIDKDFIPEDALKFIEGARKILNQDLEGFNANIQNRKEEIEDAVENAQSISLVVIHGGPAIVAQAKQSLLTFITESQSEWHNLDDGFIEIGPGELVKKLLEENKWPKIKADIYLNKYHEIHHPESTYFGIIDLQALAELHKRHGQNLFHENIRYYLGHKSDVNKSIEKTLIDNPGRFYYLNNGITAIAEMIEPKGKIKDKAKKLTLTGLSIINGAQTIATASNHLAKSPQSDISDAKVMITIIKANHRSEFSKSITKARNHQNEVNPSDFASLDDIQEDLRLKLLHLKCHYSYKPGQVESTPNQIWLNEAAIALSLFHEDPRYPVWVKTEFGSLCTPGERQYAELFNSNTNPYHLINAVEFYRYAHDVITKASDASTGRERLIYRHGIYVILWITAKSLAKFNKCKRLYSKDEISRQVGRTLDLVRDKTFDVFTNDTTSKGALAFFRNSSLTLPLMISVISKAFNLENDQEIKERFQTASYGDYPRELFKLLIAKMPSVGEFV